MQVCETMGSVKNEGATIHRDLEMYVLCTCISQNWSENTNYSRYFRQEGV